MFTLKKGKQDAALLFCSNGCDRSQLQDALSSRLGKGYVPPAKVDDGNQAAARERRQAAAGKLWLGSEPAEFSSVATYLAARGLAGVERSSALRFRGDATHPEGGRLQAMVAEVVDVDGHLIGVNRTYLCRDGSAKARVTPDKASLGPIWGGAVRLDAAAPQPVEPFDVTCIEPQLVIGEGIESSASAGALMNLPAWAALSAGNLAKGLVLPQFIRFVVIAADHDDLSRAGQTAAESAAKRWRAEGRAVRICTPDKPGTDFNDLLMERANG